MIDKIAIGELPRAPQMTKQKHGHILEMLNQDAKQHGAMANMAGMVGTDHTPKTKAKNIKWIVDSGATNHMASTLSVLINIKLVRSQLHRRVHLPNREITLVTHIGSCKIIETGILQNVLFVPNFSA